MNGFRFYRPDDALLAGVCAETGRRLGWNVWALRVLFLIGLFIQTLPTIMVYGVAALIMGVVLGSRMGTPSEADSESEFDGSLASEHLAERGRKIRDLERKFRELEREQGQG